MRTICWGVFIVLLFFTFPCRADITKVVAQDGSGDYLTIQAAFDDVPENFQDGKWIIRVKPGRYYEKIILEKGKDHVVLIGDDVQNTILTYDDYAGKPGLKGGSFSTRINADDFTAYRITFENIHLNIREKPGENKHSQGTALEVRGDRCALYDCRLVGNQDTFWGAGNGRIYVKDCYVEGNVDFIYGSSVMVLQNCIIYVNQHESYIVAPSTREGMRFGLVFLDCKIDAKPIGALDRDGVVFKSFYLGRPWHNKPQAAFIRCYEPESVHPDAWTVMNVDAYVFAEYKCTGPGAAPDRLAQRKMGGRQLTDEEASAYTVKNIFSKNTWKEYTEDWLPLPQFQL